MITKKEAVDEVIAAWKDGRKQDARLLVKMYKPVLSKELYDYLYTQTGIIEPEIISDMTLKVQRVFGGQILNQYGIEVSDPRIRKNNPTLEFRK